MTAIEQAKREPSKARSESLGEQKAAAADKVASGSRKRQDIGSPADREHPSTEDFSADSVTVPYTVAHLQVGGHILELHEVPTGVMADWIYQVVVVEGPVHMDVVARRIADACGVKRVGNRIRKSYETAIRFATRKLLIQLSGDFLCVAGQSNVPLRSRLDLPAAEKKFGWVAPAEIAGVVMTLIDGAFGYAEEDLISDTGRALGFLRVTQEMRSAIATVIANLHRDGRIALEGVNYVKTAGPLLFWSLFSGRSQKPTNRVKPNASVVRLSG